MAIVKNQGPPTIKVVFLKNDKVFEALLNSVQVTAILGSEHIEIAEFKSSDKADKIDNTVCKIDANGVSLQVYLK